MIEKLVSESEWMDALAGLPAFSIPIGPVILLAPHPDDETLATGGLLAALANEQIPVTVVAITDGDAAYEASGNPKLGELRRSEQIAALSILGITEGQVVRLGLPDRYVHEHEAELVECLISLLRDAGPDATLIAPWLNDFHADHEAVGRAAEIASAETDSALVRWFWWSWHRRTIAELKALPLKRFSLRPAWLGLKLTALAEHRSQLGEDAILPDSLLAPAQRGFEVFA